MMNKTLTNCFGRSRKFSARKKVKAYDFIFRHKPNKSMSTIKQNEQNFYTIYVFRPFCLHTQCRNKGNKNSVVAKTVD